CAPNALASRAAASMRSTAPAASSTTTSRSLKAIASPVPGDGRPRLAFRGRRSGARSSAGVRADLDPNSAGRPLAARSRAGDADGRARPAARLAQAFRRMLRAASGQVRDLLGAGDARRHALGVRRGRLAGGSEPAVAERPRDVVVFLLESEGARHA